MTLTADAPCLVTQGFNDSTTPVRVSRVPPKATFFEHCNYGGRAAALGVGDYTLTRLIQAGLRNDDISSVRVPPGLAVHLYEHDGFKGRVVTLTADAPCLVTQAFNDAASSIRVVAR